MCWLLLSPSHVEIIKSTSLFGNMTCWLFQHSKAWVWACWPKVFSYPRMACFCCHGNPSRPGLARLGGLSGCPRWAAVLGFHSDRSRPVLPRVVLQGTAARTRQQCRSAETVTRRKHHSKKKRPMGNTAICDLPLRCERSDLAAELWLTAGVFFVEEVSESWVQSTQRHGTIPCRANLADVSRMIQWWRILRGKKR